MTALARADVDAYLRDAIADELTLAPLLGWKVSAGPITYSPNVYLKGSKGSRFASSIGPAMAPAPMVWMPQWRRSHDAFELVALCALRIEWSVDSVTATAADGWGNTASFEHHPTKEAALRFVICKAAIAYLTGQAGSKA
jgi:hypothetical protein